MKTKVKILLLALFSLLLFSCELDLSYHFIENPDWIQGSWIMTDSEGEGEIIEFTKDNIYFKSLITGSLAIEENSVLNFREHINTYFDKISFKKGPGIYSYTFEFDNRPRMSRQNYIGKHVFTRISENSLRVNTFENDFEGPEQIFFRLSNLVD